MQRLTKELTLMSNLLQTSGAFSRVLDFNLARRSGVVINSIYGEIHETVMAGDVVTEGVQEIDLDPDNTDVWQGSIIPGSLQDMDQSRIFRQGFAYISRNGTAEATSEGISRHQEDWRALPLEERPLSITNLRHNLRVLQTIGAGALTAIVLVRYIIVELSLNELGIINAGRR